MNAGKDFAACCGRREFMFGAMGAGVLATGGASAADAVPPVRNVEAPALRFGLLTDSHYAQKDPWPKSGHGMRCYRDSTAKMREAVAAFNREKVDFAIELGDMKDMGVPEIAKAGKKVKRDAEEIRRETLGFLDEIEGVFAQFEGPRYHVLGNHDMDSISKEDFLSHTSNHGAAKGKGNYSFEMKGFKFIVLDGCFRADRKPYCRGNFNWTKAFFPDAELEWLDAELSSATTPVFVFCHQLLDGFSKISRSLVIGNWQQAVEMFERRGNVLCVFQGHHHDGLYGFRKGIHYWTMKGMITGPYPSCNSFAVVDVSKNGDVSVSGFADCPNRHLPAHRAP